MDVADEAWVHERDATARGDRGEQLGGLGGVGGCPYVKAE